MSKLLMFLFFTLGCYCMAVTEAKRELNLSQSEVYFTGNIPMDSSTHICSDRSHKSCDGNCECDGLACTAMFQERFQYYFTTIGYSEEWSYHMAAVEGGLIPIDSTYNAMIED
jgi:hypothetical protein